VLAMLIVDTLYLTFSCFSSCDFSAAACILVHVMQLLAAFGSNLRGEVQT